MNRFFDKVLRSILSKTPLYRAIDRYWLPNFKYLFKKIGNNTQIITPLTVRPQNMDLDDFVRIQNHVNMISNQGQFRVKKYSSIGSGTVIIPDSHRPTVGLPQFFSYLHINDEEREIIVEEDCWVGASCILLSKCHIGRGSIVAAGSVVTKNVLPYSVVAGNPAKIIAVRFTKQQILEHERILYPAEERMKEAELDELFDKAYNGFSSIGVSAMNNYDREKLKIEQARMNFKSHSNT